MPIKYVPFIPEPVEGQAVLGNFNRILKYKGADDVSMTLQRGMPLYEMEKQETVGENADGNMVIRGECVSACAYLKERGIQVDLVYIDPPFASGADYAKKVYIRRNPKVAEAIAQAEQELDVDELNVNRFASNHDVIFVYTKSEEYFFTPIKEKRDEVVRQIKRVWDPDTQKLVNAKDENGKVIYQESSEKTIDDVWRMSMLQPADKEEPVGYATQKPEALINRAISASSDEGMVVADFFGGSGTTVSCANKLGRKFIHCDIGLNSIQTTRDRLASDGASFDVLEIKDGVQLYRNPVQTMDKIKSLIPGLKNEDSLDSFWEGAISDSKLGTVPVYVPNLMDSASKLLDKVTMNRIIHQAIPDLDSNIKKVIVYYIDITDEAEIQKFIKDDDSTNIEIELRDLKTILDDVIIGDYAEFHAEETHEDLLGGYAVTIDKFISDRVLSKIAEFNQKAFLNSSAKKPYKPIEISEDGLELIEFLSIDCTAAEGEWHSDSEIKIDKNGFVVVNGNKTKNFWDGKIRCEQKPLRLKIRNICGDETVWEV